MFRLLNITQQYFINNEIKYNNNNIININFLLTKLYISWLEIKKNIVINFLPLNYKWISCKLRVN